MRVGKDRVVTLDYTARLDSGEVVDTTERCGPVSYLQGNEQIFPALEQAVEGLEAGAQSELRVTPDESFGERREQLVRRLPRTRLPADLPLVAGERYSVKAADGSRLVFRVVAVEADEVVADFNTRGAGQGLHISFKVLAVRPATEEELRRGTLR
jgi:FKBP-type peptidyl-prolyl cis-trans isomerase SlyD